MKRSLRFRLSVGALIAIALALLFVWFILGDLFEDYVEQQYRAEMSAVSDALAARIIERGDKLVLLSEPTDPRYQIPAGGRYWQASTLDGKVLLRSRSLWDLQLSPGSFSPDLYCGFHQAEGPDGETMLLSSHPVTLASGKGAVPILIYTGFSKAEMETSLETYHWPLKWMLMTTGALLLLAAVLQVLLGLRPFTRLSREVAAIRAGGSNQIQMEAPEEVMPLITEINLLLDERRSAVERARARASDLAHGLKTPLTVLSHLLEGLPHDKRDIGLSQIDLIRQRSDRQLQAARLGVEQMATTSLFSITGKLINVLSPITAQRSIEWQVTIDQSMTVQADPADLAEAIGNILDNAIRFAHSRISIIAEEIGTELVLRIADDGPGIPAQDFQKLSQRGAIGDEEATGTGLGLAITSDIVVAYGGRLTLAASMMGGLEVALWFPRTVGRINSKAHAEIGQHGPLFSLSESANVTEAPSR